jgi:hypothetical protein
MRFMHVADIPLGYRQYGSNERFNDSSQVFLHVVEQAVDQQVDFFLRAGDLFEKRTVDPLAMRVAIEGLRMLCEAGIPATWCGWSRKTGPAGWWRRDVSPGASDRGAGDQDRRPLSAVSGVLSNDQGWRKGKRGIALSCQSISLLC